MFPPRVAGCPSCLRSHCSISALEILLRGPQSRVPGGIGYAEKQLGEVRVSALCAVNAFGDIDHGTTYISLESVAHLTRPFEGSRTHTTVGAVITNARLDKVGCRIVAQGAHDGLSRALTPPHTRYDGDGFIAAATGEVDTDVDVVRLMTLAAVTEAIRSVASGS